MEKLDSSRDGLHQDLADRFGALARLFGNLGSPRAVEELLDSLISDDPAVFNRFVDGVDLPMLGKCAWLQEIIERVIVAPTGLVPGDCWLRDNLGPSERQLYLQIALRHRSKSAGLVTKSLEVRLQNGHLVIPPGPFLEELKANGLLACDPDRWTYDTTLTLGLSPPERVCI